MNKCIITSASDKFFPSLINFLGSLHTNYPDHPEVYVYDIGLFPLFRHELEEISWVHVLDVPHFVKHWRACYTWKTYILNTPHADLNLYIDAGAEILQSLEPLFEKINKQGYLAVSQGPAVSLADVTPPEFFARFELSKEYETKEVITAGIFGFKKNPNVSVVTKDLYDAGAEGLCLGFSKNEQWKNKGLNATDIVPDCKMFRHDTTMISVLLYKYITDLAIEPVEHFSSNLFGKEKGQYIWNNRQNFKILEYVDRKILNSDAKIAATFNRMCISGFLLIKWINRKIKRLP